MLIKFDQISETVIPKMRDGEGQVVFHMHVDGDNKIMQGLLAPGCSIGLHTHDNSLINAGKDDLTFFAVVPEHGA